MVLLTVTSVVKSIYNRSTSILTHGNPDSTPDPTDPSKFSTVQTVNDLFPCVDPQTDGADCLEDCSTCTIKYPSRFKVDETEELYGHINGWSTHVLVATGKSDWVRDVTDEEGSVMSALGAQDASKPQNGKLMLSASNILPPDEYYHSAIGDQPTTVLVLPAFTFVDRVKPSDVPELIERFIETSPTSTTPLSAPPPSSPSLVGSSLSFRPCPHKYIILLCSQKTRDARCGQSAPLLRKEFERHLRPLGLHRDLDDERPGGVGIYFISHVGGHKYSANVLIYRRGDVKTPEATIDKIEDHPDQPMTLSSQTHQTTELDQAIHGKMTELSITAVEEAPSSDPPLQSSRPSQQNSNQALPHPTDSNHSQDSESTDSSTSLNTLPSSSQSISDLATETSAQKATIQPSPHLPGASAIQAIWLARVRPEDCEGIIKFTVLQGKVVNPEGQLRGGWDRQRQLVSW